jgi:hypothetical protein
MAIKLSSNPTCVLSDADNLTAEQRQKINMNLTKGIPGSDIEGDKVTVINSDGEVEMKAYSAGGGGGSSYSAGGGIDISNDTISAKVAGPLYIDEYDEDNICLSYDSSSLESRYGQLRVKAAPYYLDYNPQYMYVPDIDEFKQIIQDHRPVYLRIETSGSEQGNGLYIPATEAKWRDDRDKEGEWLVSFTFETHDVSEYDLYTRSVKTEKWTVSRDQSTRAGESVPTHTTTNSYMINPESYTAFMRSLEIPSWDKDGADIGKVLKIDSNNELSWATP